ncbi:MAG: aspartate aminotransferase family protein [Candidatus Saganbacteria bacterium]|nr:aspartate aminotransferase family protein [Candidatus Saganbacteria bacterium]
MKEKEDLVSRGKKVLSPVLAHYTELEVTRGRGTYLFGADGKKYLDFAPGIAGTNIGHCHPKVVAAAEKQIHNLIHACAGIVYYEQNIALAEKLKEIAPGDLSMSFFCQSGSEAVEGALKLAKYVTGKPGIICFKGSFHGRTLGALSITTSKEKYQKGYKPLLPNVFVAPYPYLFQAGGKAEKLAKKCLSETEKILKKNKGKIATMIVEPIQGEGGYVVPPKKFLQGLRALCNKHNVLLIFDEVQSGFGRTGKMFASEHFGVIPDIMALAKALASGFPLGAVVSTEELMTKWSPGAHGGTLTGNPVSCAAALATIDVIENEKLAKNSEELGNYFKKKLEELKGKYPVIGDVRGLGLMIGVEFVKSGTNEPNPEAVKFILKECLRTGLILISCGTCDQVIRFIPPLSVSKEEIDQAFNIFEKALEIA